MSNKLKELFADPLFDDKALKGASKAVLGIGRWCKAIIKYDEAMKVVKPKQIELKEAKESLAEALAKLEVAQAKLKEVQDKL